MTSANDNQAERLARMAGEAAELVVAWRRLRAARAAGALSEAEYQAALRELEREQAHEDQASTDDDPGAAVKAP